MSLRVEGLSKSFAERAVLKSIDFSIPEGQIAFFLGQSGTGKSVLLKILVGLLQADSGSVFVQETNVTNFSETQWRQVRKQCGLVFQQPALFDSLSVFENLAFGPRRLMTLSEAQISERATRVLKSVHLDPDVLIKRPGQLSFGMQKRVSLARTLILEPKILLFDEPTTGLDPVTTTAINRLILEISREYGTTSVVVSHDMKCAMEIADRILFLDQGRIVFDGPSSQVKRAEHPLVQGFFEEIP
ncbi:MAG: ABC transporter ATP-binding protein [Bdellovibrionales bacterium]